MKSIRWNDVQNYKIKRRKMTVRTKRHRQTAGCGGAYPCLHNLRFSYLFKNDFTVLSITGNSTFQ